MNKFAIPALLVATVMVAGMFAFVPVEQASTVHTTSTATVSAATIALVADEMLELREISVTDVDFDGAQSIRITGADAADEFKLISLFMTPGTAGGVANTDEINIDGLTVDGAIGGLTNLVDTDITAGGLELIQEIDIEPPTGNIITLAMSAGTVNPTDGETISFVGKILIRESAGNPVITTS